MGTRSLTFLMDGNGSHLATVYRQFDGYLDGHGKQLAKLADRIIVNGIGEGFKAETHANGFQELAAKIVAGLKSENDQGNIYLSAIKDMNGDLGWADYAYVIRPGDDGQVFMECHEVRSENNTKIGVCKPSKYAEWLAAYEEKLEAEEV